MARPTSRSNICCRLRAIPNLAVYRPCDAVETAEAWALALADAARPSVLALSRQNLPQLRLVGGRESDRQGRLSPASPPRQPAGWCFSPPAPKSKSPWPLRVALEADGIGCDVVSMPCWEAFDAQRCRLSRRYCCPMTCCCVSVEAGVTLGWERYTGNEGLNIGVDSFRCLGADRRDVYAHFGLTGPQVAARVRERSRLKALPAVISLQMHRPAADAAGQSEEG